MVLNQTERVENNPLKMENVEVPKVGKTQVLVKIISCGVCGSELQMIEGRWQKYGSPPKLPLIPGHEIIGRVYEFGKSVKTFKIGQLVGLQYLWDSCGKCNFCLSGNENMCSSASVTGETVNGGYSEYILGNQDHVYHIPEGMDPVGSSPLMGAGITAYRAVKKALPREGRTIAIVGAGGIGQMAIQFAKLGGAHVIALSRNEARRKISLELGADEVLDPGVDYTDILSIRRRADSVIVFAPSERAAEASMKICKKMGTVILGVYTTISDFRFTDEISVSGTLIANRAETMEVIKMVSDGKIKINTRVFPMESANIALNMLKHSRIEGRAVLKM
ncbi:MAG: alcohol dehydrogenase catalytic domain-containing protein [Thermoplasmataceae archaeon]